MTAEIANTKNEIILYQPDNSIELEVMIEEDTVWLNRHQMALLFDRDVKTIGKHINNVFSENELEKEVVVANFATTTQHGAIKGKTQTLSVEYYNLDMIISVGYRVKSKRGTQFRIWATKTLKEYILKGYAISQRFEQVDNKLFQHEQRLLNAEKQIDFFVRTSLPPVEGVFYNGQIFDAFLFVADLIKSAKKEIVLIDNYLNENVLALLAKRSNGVKASIYTADTAKLQPDLIIHNAQYPEIRIEKKPNIHDRFLVIDNDLYHIGASIKDLGKKLFAFSKMEMTAGELLKNIH
ncbi:MAG: virulence RhuM family protein [Prevotellaceae bacterium]|jgi:hypothetical protein|nr:virulence RhuM family protein [Prevotellaceae bacterium]